MAGLLTVGDAVSAELRRWAVEPFGWRYANCGQSVLYYVERRKGVRPAGIGRPVFTGKGDALRFVREAGGMEALCTKAMAALDCPVTDTPVRGDVALVPVGRYVAAAICTGPLWAVRGDNGPVLQDAAPVIAWRVA